MCLQLGDGTTTNRFTPVAFRDGIGVTSLTRIFILTSVRALWSGFWYLVVSQNTFQPTTGCTKVDVFVANFGTSYACIRSSIGITASQRSQWISDSVINSRLSSGWGQSLRISFSSDLRVFQTNKLFSYALAKGSSFTMNVPTSGSVIISVVGSFFVVESSATVYTGRSSCLSTSWKSSSTMFCRIAGGLGSGWPLHFSLQARATLGLMSFDRIRLESMIYSNASVHVYGSGFGRDLATVVESSKEPPTLIPAYSSANVASLSIENKKTEFQLDSITASVEFDDVSRLDDVSISLIPPTQVFASTVPLLYSRCFGCLMHASSSIQFIFSDNAVSEVPSFGCGSGVFKPHGSFKLKELLSSIAAFGQWSLLIKTGSSNLRIRSAGIEFVMSSLKVSVGSTPVSTLVWSSDSSLSISVAPGYGHSLNLSATSAMQLSSNVLKYSYLNPVIVAMQPAVLSSTAASRVLLVGSRYQIIDFSPRLRINTACTASVWISDSSVVCRLASSRKAYLPASVTLGLTRISSESVVTGVSLPTASSLSPKTKQFTGSVIVEIFGRAFGVHGISSRVSVEGSSAVATAWLSDSQLVSKMTLPVQALAFLIATVSRFVARTALDNISVVVAASCSARNIPATGSYVDFIYGTTSGVHSASHSARLGSTAVERFLWISSSATFCKLPSGSRTLMPSGSGIIASFSQQVDVASVRHAPPVASNFLMSANKTANLHSGAMEGSGFGVNNPSAQVKIEAVMSRKTEWYSDSSLTTVLNANQISTDLLFLNVAFSNSNNDLVASSQVMSSLFIPKPLPLIQAITAKLYLPIPVDVSERLDVFRARGVAAAGDLPSPDNYEADVGFMEEMNVTAIIYNNGSQVFSKDSFAVSKPITGSFSFVDAVTFRAVNITCGGVEHPITANLAANTFAVSVSVGLVFCPSFSIRVIAILTFTIPGKCLTRFMCNIVRYMVFLVFIVACPYCN